MNEYEIEDALHRFADHDLVNLYRAALILWRLAGEVNSMSDGWPYWQAPRKASARLQALVEGADRLDPQDVSESDLKAALTPLKRFLTKYGIDHSRVL